jgi:hypothetical protein
MLVDTAGSLFRGKSFDGENVTWEKNGYFPSTITNPYGRT